MKADATQQNPSQCGSVNSYSNKTKAPETKPEPSPRAISKEAVVYVIDLDGNTNKKPLDEIKLSELSCDRSVFNLKLTLSKSDPVINKINPYSDRSNSTSSPDTSQPKRSRLENNSAEDSEGRCQSLP